MKIVKSIIDLVGYTPTVELVRLEKKYGLKARLCAKLEYFNPAGSAKDRIAKAMIDDAEKSSYNKSNTLGIHFSIL